MKNNHLNLTWHYDPGHAWLAVPRHFLSNEVLATISSYSYQTKNGGSVLYLEQDCDAPKALEYFKSIGIEVSTDEISLDCDHYCRSYPSFRQ